MYLKGILAIRCSAFTVFSHLYHCKHAQLSCCAALQPCMLWPGRALEAERAAAATACADARKQQPGRGITPAELDRLLREQRHDAERRCLSLNTHETSCTLILHHGHIACCVMTLIVMLRKQGRNPVEQCT